uniref:Uncharacterized protein n=1 Tax=Heliothis virescens TaxID=7102 RepID=A0A2A4JAT5_HELVI
MENEVKQRNQRNRRRERAQRMQAQRESKVKDGDSGEDESPTREKPPRPPARRKKSREPLGEEDIIDGFAIMAFRTYEDLEITDDDYVCEACWELAMVAVNQNLQLDANEGEQSGPSHRGHINVCLLCGCSLVRRQSDKVLKDNPTELQQDMINIIQMKIEPRQITDDDYVCEACWELAMVAVNQNLQLDANEGEQSGPSHRGHINVCLLCGCSLVRRQSDKVLKDNPTELQQDMINIIQMKIEPRQLTTSDKVCHACWLRTKREALRVNRVNEMRPPEAMSQNENLSQNQETEVHENPQATDIGRSDSIILPDYKRAANTEQVQHIFSFVNAFNPTLDFENIQEMDERIFEYWVGFSKEKINTLLEETPRIQEIGGGRLGLVSLLMKMRTGDSDERIATLVQKPRRSLETLMDRVREVLVQDFVPRYLETRYKMCQVPQVARNAMSVESGADVRGYSAAGGCRAVATYLGDLPAIDRAASRPSRSDTLKRVTRTNVNMSLQLPLLMTLLQNAENALSASLSDI